MQVLVVEDSPVYRRLLGGRLEDWGFQPKIVESGEQAWRHIQQPDSPKLVLLDWVLPDFDGIELCKRIRSRTAQAAYTYVILLTGKDGQQDLLRAMEAGADDYIAKPFQDLELRARLLVGKRIVELQQELISARESMRHAAMHDPLTNLLNRAAMMEFLGRELERGRRDRKPVGVVLVDIDHFKRVNDTYGHLGGDEALKEVARRLQARLRVYDGVGRYGGEEFLLLLAGCDLMTTIIRADQLRAHIAGSPIRCGKSSTTITVSMGVANSEAVGDIQLLLKQADLGLYRAKEKGRNRVEHVESVDAAPPTPSLVPCENAGRR